MMMLMGVAGLTFSAANLNRDQLNEAEENLNEVEIDFADSLKEGEMKELKVGPGDKDKVLIVRYQGKIRAVGNYCTHFGAPMSAGVLVEDKVMCPWHQAAFSVVSGAVETGPSIDGLPTFEVVEKEGKPFVKVPVTLPKKQSQALTKRDPNDKRKYVIIGGGTAGLLCAETLRQSGYTGEVLLLTAENIVPYDRTLLTKGLPNVDVNNLKLRDEAYLQNADIDIKLGARVESVSTDSKQLTLSDGTQISYDKLCIATGAAPFKPRIPGIDQENVLVLRSGDDQTEIKKRIDSAKSIIILGGGFIGSESAAAIKNKYKDAKDVHLIYMEKTPLERQFGTEVGGYIGDVHASNGVKLYPQRKVTEIKGENNQAKTVVLDDGTQIDGELVLVGAGVLPATKFLAGSGINVDQWGGVIVDPFLQTNVKDVYAAGDIASYPYWQNGKLQRIEHYISAMDQGSHVAFNMLGKMIPFGTVPFLWTNHYGRGTQYAGYASDYDEVYIEGNFKDNKFVVYLAKQGKILAIIGQQSAHTVLNYYEAMNQNLLPSLADIKSGKENVETVRAKLKQNKGGSACKREKCCQKKPVVATT